MTAVAATAVPLSTPALWLTGIERGLMFAGLALALGGLAGRGLARQYKGTRPGPLPPPWALRGALIGLAASCALLVTAVAGPGIATGLAQPAPPGLGSGGTAEIAAVEAVLFALATLVLRLRRPGWAAVLLSGVVLAEGLRSHPEGVIPVAGALVTYCHLLPAILWAGMLAYALRAAIAWRAYPVAAQGIIRLYSTAAAWLFALVVITGIVSALVLVPLSSVLTTAYGRFLIAKAVIVGVAAGLAVAGRMWLRRPSAPHVGPALVTRLEVCALAAVLLITGILTVLTPPAKPASASSAAQDQAAIWRHPVGLPAAAAHPWAGLR
ncbi:MAG TPA: CopD family protein [Streptosporangiaceae bacterium]|nr:CopD family protein [Streptosporangiaceae bacterium]